MMRGNTLAFVVYFILGLYVINAGFNFVVMPDLILSIQKWIFLIGGALIIFAGIKFLSRRNMMIGR
ncbi:MAG TPA: hypothetical protein VMC07_00130 [Candidatus Omnitrophota bacterium]|nr:hypothetical protein [Candidatus Omnitrophota bacterium]